MADIIGWDIGGAHLKAARLQDSGHVQAVVQLPCPLWRGTAHLETAVEEALAAFGGAPRHAITMTGELADIFTNRAEGVARIVALMQKMLPGSDLRIFSGMRGFVSPQQVASCFAEIASANWLASATFAASQAGEGVFIDIGSTTTDIVRLQGGKAMPQGLTDAARLASDELVYTGAIRTPLMAVAQKVYFRGRRQRLAAEHFATMADIYRLTGDLEPAHDMTETADGADKSPQASARRLARMVGHDVEDAGMDEWVALAQFFAAAQREDIRDAISHIAPGTVTPLIGAGAGRFVIRRLAEELGRPYLDFADWVDAEPATQDWAAVCAPAYAVACLGLDI